MKHTRRLITLGLVVVLWLVFALTTDNFVTARNTFMLLKETAFVGIIAIGMCFVMVGGGIDLSAGGIVCVVAILCARVSFIPGLPGVLVLLCGLLLGAVFGAVNAFFVTRLHLTEFVATLASGFVFSGLGLVLAFHNEAGTLISKSITNKSFLLLGKSVGGLYPITIVWLLLSAAALLVLVGTKFGAHTYAMGSNAASSAMSGVDTRRVKALGFLLCGAMAGVAAAMQVAYQTAASTSLGGGYEFQAIAACVVGGVVLGGGKGDPIGAALGSLFMCMILNGLNKFGLSSAWQYVAEGAIIIVATGFDAGFTRLAGSLSRLLPVSKGGEGR